MVRINEIPKRTYVSERFEDIEKVYPYHILVDQKLPDFAGEFGVLMCPECGQCGIFYLDAIADISLRFDGCGNIIYNIEENEFNIKEGEVFSLYHQIDYNDPGYEDEVALFDNHGDYLSHSGKGPWCPNCGAMMGYNMDSCGEDCPGCNKCLHEPRKSLVFMNCARCLLNVANPDCSDCSNNYGRVKHKIEISDVCKFLEGVPQDE